MCPPAWDPTGGAEGLFTRAQKWGHFGSQQGTICGLLLGVPVCGQGHRFVRCWALPGSNGRLSILGRSPVIHTWPEGGSSPCVWMGISFSEAFKVGQLLLDRLQPLVVRKRPRFCFQRVAGGPICTTHHSTASKGKEQPLAKGPSPQGAL